MRHPPDRQKGEAPTLGPVEASVPNPTLARKGIDAMDSTPSPAIFQGPNEALFPFGQKAAQRLQGLQPGRLSAMLTTQAGQALTGWMTSVSEVLAATDRLISEFGRDAVQLRVEEALR